MRPIRELTTLVRDPRGLVTRVASSRRARETSWALVAELVRMVTQLAVFLVITHLFAADDYGLYVGAIGLLGFAFPFATFGASYLLLQRVAGQGVAPNEAMRHAVTTVVTGGVLTSALLVALRPWVLPQASLTVLAAIAVTELVFSGVQDLAVVMAQATHRLHVSVPVRLAAGLTRLAAVLVLWATTPRPTLVQLTVSNLLAAVVATGLAVVVLARQGIRLGRPGRLRAVDVRQGLPFSVGFSADKLRETADSVLLVRLGKPTDSGIYGAAGRLVDMAVVPLRSLSHASNARLFERGRESIRDGRTEARRVTLVALAYAMPAAALMALLGPSVISVLPSSYQSAAQAVRLLALWPIAVAVETFAGSALTAVGHHRIRVVANVSSAALNVVLNLVLIPHHGWRGSVAATLATSFTSSIAMWGALATLAHRERTRRSDHAEPADQELDARRARS